MEWGVRGRGGAMEGKGGLKITENLKNGDTIASFIYIYIYIYKVD